MGVAGAARTVVLCHVDRSPDVVVVFFFFKQKTAYEMVHVPYRGGAPAMNDVVAGHVDLLNGSAALLAPQIAAGKLRALFQMGPTRLAVLGEAPTISEAGYPRAEAMAWWGLYAPGGTPKPIIER